MSLESEPVIIAVDCAGGEDAPKKVIAGLLLFCRKIKDAQFILYGDEGAIAPLLARYEPLRPFIKGVHHTPVVILDEDKPSTVLRSKKDSSLFLAVDSVKEGKADAVVSAGNTGAYMSKAVISLRMLEGIDRPAIITRIPTKKLPVSLLDLGANAICSADNLVQFALMGQAYTRVVSENEIAHPRVCVLNIGGEDGKGHDVVQEAHKKLKELKGIQYGGFIEGTHIYEGEAHVVVTDGFTGNILLKVIEGTVRFLGRSSLKYLRRNLLGWIGGLLCLWPLLKLKSRLDPRIYNGAMFIGLKGICVKSHGSADAFAFSRAVRVAYFLAKEHINDQIHDELKENHLLKGL